MSGAPSPPALVDYDWAILRAVPDVCSGVWLPLGVVLHARRADFLGMELHEAPIDGLDPSLLTRSRDGLRRIAAGAADAGPVALLPPSERFHWLVAVRSAAIQSTPVHTGRALDPAAALVELYRGLIGSTPPASR